MGSIIVGTNTEDDSVAVVGGEVHTFVETILSVCAVASEILVAENAQLGIVGTGTEMLK